MLVAQILRRKRDEEVITIEASASVVAAAGLLHRHTIGGLPVVAPDGGVIGYVAERHIVSAVNGHHGSVEQLTVREIMDRPAPTCSPDDPLPDVMTRMTRQRLRHLIVVEGDEIVGVVSVGDLVKHRIEELKTEAGVLRDYVLAQRAKK